MTLGRVPVAYPTHNRHRDADRDPGHASTCDRPQVRRITDDQLAMALDERDTAAAKVEAQAA
jgi:hypothetical protein